MAQPRTSDAFKFLTQGGIIQEFNVGGRNIVLGFESPEPYKHRSSHFFGENIGRVANRISGAKINSLNGNSYDLAVNNGPNTLHGGAQGWGKKTFAGPEKVTRNGRDALEFKYLSKDGEEGFPGTVELRMWYYTTVEQDEGKEKTSLEIEYEVELVGDEVEETIVSVTNHSYFNISDGPTHEGTKTVVHTNLHLPVDDTAIPTGAIEPYPEFEANKEFTLGAEKPDPDHCFVMNPDPSSIPLDTRKEPMKKLVELSHPNTNIHFEALSTEPAFQFYAGKFIEAPPAKDGLPARGPRSGLCIEASRYVNAVNQDGWRQQVVLRKGQLWGSRTIYRAWKE
ncbi:Putative aldose 1-/Glucose-6-phosphate 1-epimerase, galactose mutarotase-like domain superfamily [Septoria linicola]|uniref:Aldose 1-/Glucose-6-phosphate 1-epimerase, galactose mutarotase-like domain superfamily n=1 Tax=Septoria linicola TaxID=215465 RepID=A0A9Q9ESB1_9PEZI|nr:putative aldose 1-/Glucose-6-phosphate 1-epimerase, galactose mutarotase-like domain superfamily [Septoria linicola]USW59418.1 Putative aldose 1-/Glucose-6-phosphate 1-epimerase, galactose mutarotase-like domain superfamily [Septoria linicola]